MLRARIGTPSLWNSSVCLSLRAALSNIAVTTEANVKLELHDLPPYEFSELELQTYNAAVEVINRLKAYGHPASYICGGWVRDKYLNRPSLDIDIATSCDANSVRRLFRRTQVLPRNTVRVLHEDGRSQFEVTTFRGYSRSNDLLSACLDAEMRDFTMNALFYDTEQLKVMDFIGGVPDLQRRVLRLCRDPRARLQEDPLRVLRGLRFATTMRFKLSPDTAQAMRAVGPLCSPEQGMPAGRIWKELQKMNSAEEKFPGSFTAAMRLAFHLGILRHIVPFLSSEEALAKAVAVAEKLPHSMPLELRLAAMMHPSSKLEEYLQLARRFSLGLAEKSNVELLHRLTEMCMASGPGGPEAAAARNQEQWVQFYADPHSELCQKVLEAWMPQLVVAQFQQFHAEQRGRLADEIAAARQRHEQEVEARRNAPKRPTHLAHLRRRSNPRVGDLLPAEYLEQIIQSYNQRHAKPSRPTSNPDLPPTPDTTSNPDLATPPVDTLDPDLSLASTPDPIPPWPLTSTSSPSLSPSTSTFNTQPVTPTAPSAEPPSTPQQPSTSSSSTANELPSATAASHTWNPNSSSSPPSHSPPAPTASITPHPDSPALHPPSAQATPPPSPSPAVASGAPCSTDLATAAASQAQLHSSVSHARATDADTMAALSNASTLL